MHRDIKPGNLFLCDSGLVKVTDFGIAKAASGTRLTATGTLVGTFPCMAPEQWLGEPASPANDMWAVGCVLYELLSGTLPRSYATPSEYVATAARGQRVAPLPATGIPAWLSAAVMEMLRPDPRDRPAAADCAALLADPGAAPGLRRKPCRKIIEGEPLSEDHAVYHAYVGRPTPDNARARDPVTYFDSTAGGWPCGCDCGDEAYAGEFVCGQFTPA